MASNIKFKRSSVQNRVPTTAQLELGELALNTYDGKLYTEINTGSAAVVEIGSKLSSLVVDGDNGGGNGDVTFHGATAGRDITWDASADSLIAKDNAKIVVGDGTDLSIYSDGTNGLILSDALRLKNKSGGDVYLKADSGAAVELYHNDLKRFETTADGADISGTGSLKLPVGTTAQRSGSPTAGDMRYNSTTGSFEGYTNGWGELGGAGIGIGSTSVNPGSGVVGNVVGVGYTTINFVGAGLSVTGYGTTIVVDLGEAVSRKYGRKIHSYTATANQTAFTGLSYTDGVTQVSVYLNGAKLSAATYTATSGSTVVLGTGASVGDEVEILVIDSGVDISRTVHSYTATAGQTAFTGLGYEDGGDLDVYLNGIRLAQSDYTANNGTILTLATGASVGDLLEIVDMGPGAEFKSGFGADTNDIYRMQGGVGIGTTNPTDKLNIVGNAEVIGVLTATTFKGAVSGTTGTFSGDVNIVDKIIHTGDTDTAIRFSANDTIKLETGGTARVTVTNATTTVANNLTVTGNLQVDGTNTVVNSTTMTVDDKNIVLASGAANDAAADGGGITLESGNGNKTFNWVDSTDAWTSSEHIHVVAGKRLGVGAAPSYPLHVTSTDNESVRFYGDSGGSNALLRFQFDEINDDVVGAAGPRTFIGDGAADIVIGTQNSSFSPTNSFISLEHGGKVRIAAGASPTLASEGLTIDTNGRLGINEGTPDRELHISSATNGGIIRLTNTDTTITDGTICGMLEFEQLDSNTPGVSANIRAEMQDTTNGANKLCFSTGTPSTIGTRLSITSGGDVLLGTHQATIGMDTSDGSDNKYWSLCGGSDASQSRGAIITIYGNEAADANSKVGTLSLKSGNTTTGFIDFWTQSTKRLEITSGGAIQNHYNTSLPVTDSRPILQLGYSVIGDDSSGFNAVTCNAYPVSGDASWHYIGSSSLGASKYELKFGEHKWYTAAAGTRGNDITWSERMSLTSGGDVYFNGNQTGNNRGIIYNHATGFGFYGSSSGGVDRDIIFYSNSGSNSEKFRIKSTGEVHISDRNSSSAGQHVFQAGSFGIRMEDTGGYNRWNIERNYGGWQSTPIVHLSAQGRVGINQASPSYDLEVNGSFAATTKSFVIDHPTKENHKLRYACLEGPENSVYVRGRSSDPVIELPDYWVGLVHDDSITVNVTPIGNKNVWVESINNNSVTIGSDDSTEYFYTVFAERKDVEKLEVEVEK